MTSHITIGKLPKNHEELLFVGEWNGGDGKVPIYHARSMHALNRVIGYARYINRDFGTVLYRGQNHLYDSLLPSGAREGANVVSDDLLEALGANEKVLRLFGLLEEDTLGWKHYQDVVIESVLQHYGAKTFCMDFVDNHWCALWFGAHEFKDSQYERRKDDGSLYIILYAAETACPSIKGLYIGRDTYTVDLRKALPSFFQRPASQHGWMVRNKHRKPADLDNRVIGIIEVSVSDAQKWLGSGDLLSAENFFPSFLVDQGYKVLLSYQQRSGVESKTSRLLPVETVRNYHLADLAYCSDWKRLETMLGRQESAQGPKKCSISEVFRFLLTVGWSKESCEREEYWDAGLPYKGQSGVTALFVQELFGGNLGYCVYSRKKRAHYFNIIDGIVLDFTFNELPNNLIQNYPEKLEENTKDEFRGVKLRKKSRGKLKKLLSEWLGFQGKNSDID